MLATTLVAGLPAAGAIVVFLSNSGDARLQLALLLGVGSAALLVSIGTYLWKRRPESADVSFGEIMLWRFFKRARAEEKLNESARALGLDSGGRPQRRTQMSAAERLKILHSLAVALESKDPYTHGHSTRVEHLSVRTARALGMSDAELKDLRTAALLHDVGKIRIPNRILRKPSELTLEEKLVVQEHSSVGAWMVSGVSNRRVVLSVRHHHERWDGNGYPDGVSGRGIPLLARIIAGADSFDAMTSSRPYRNSMSRDSALEELRLEAGAQFDPVVVDAFLEGLPRRITVPGFIAPSSAAAMLRKALNWARRTGSAQVAETVAGAGVAAVVAASVFVPPAALPSESNAAASTPELTLVQPAPIVADPLSPPPEQKRNKVLGAVVKRHKKAGGDGKAKDSGDATAVAVSPGDGGGTRGSGPSSPPKASSKPVVKPENPPPPSDPNPANPPGDPQPDLGRDCIDHPGRGQGHGNGMHCG